MFGVLKLKNVKDTTNKAPTFTEVNRYTTSVTWADVPNCAAGGGNTQFNYTVSMPSVGMISINLSSIVNLV